MNIDHPIFIIGSGRSGTTLLLNLLAKHPDLAWFSNYVDFYPDKHWIMILSRLREIPVVGSKISGLIPGILHSHESINIYKYCGIHNLIYDKKAPLTENDVTPQSATCFRDIVAKCLRFSGKSRFLNKNTNNCARIRYLNAIFPKSKYIHIIRDGRAVSNSLINVDWWSDLTLWWSDYSPNDWNSTGKPAIELCAHHWQQMVRTVLSAVPYLEDDQYIEVGYEELTANPLTEMRKLIKFCDLRWTKDFENQIKKQPIYNFNNKWSENLSMSDQQILEDSLSDLLSELGYQV